MENENKYAVLEKALKALHQIDHEELSKRGLTLLEHKVRKDLDYHPTRDGPLDPHILPEYSEDTFEIDLVVGGHALRYWRRVRACDNISSIDCTMGNQSDATIVEVDPDHTDDGGWEVYLDVLDIDSIEKLNKHLSKIAGIEKELPPEQQKLLTEFH